MNTTNSTSFPLANNVKIVAPFWSTTDLTTSDQIKSLLISSNTTADDDFDTMNYLEEVNSFLQESWNVNYSAKWILVVQWLDICTADAVCEDKVSSSSHACLPISIDMYTCSQLQKCHYFSCVLISNNAVHCRSVFKQL